MSEFLNAVKHELIGTRKHKPFWMEPLSARYKVTEATIATDYLEEHRFSVRYEAGAFLSPTDSGAREAMLRSFIRQFRDAVYGDLREHAIELERAMYEWDMDAMRKKVGDIMGVIYGE